MHTQSILIFSLSYVHDYIIIDYLKYDYIIIDYLKYDYIIIDYLKYDYSKLQ